MSKGDPLWRRLAADARHGRFPGYLRVRQEAHFLLASARALIRPPRQAREPEIHVFVLWSNALSQEQRILRDISDEFVVLDVRRVSWPVPEFSWNLTRFYGGTLPPRAEKEMHCGTDPFLVVVIEDSTPTYAPRRTPKGVVNARTFDAKQRHRRWTGGGHRIHASLDPIEAEHDLFLLLGRRTDDYRATRVPWNGEIAAGPDGPVGAAGWESVAELLTAIEVATPYVLLAESADELEVQVQDPTRAALTANVPAAEIGTRERHELLVAGRPFALALRSAGKGSVEGTR